jgi:hypothetical protein
MAPEDGSFSRKLRHFLRSQRFAISIVVLAIGVVLTVLAVSDFTPLGSSGPFPAINKVTDQSSTNGPNVNLAFIVIGPIVAIIGAYLVGAYYVARREFEHLMRTKSKAEFLRNIPELENLLWDLRPEDEIRYEDKKAELRVRR